MIEFVTTSQSGNVTAHGIFNSIVLKANLDKMHVMNNGFYAKESIENVTVKKFALLNNTVKTVIIKTNDGKKHYLFARPKEDKIQFQEEGFNKLVEKYSK